MAEEFTNIIGGEFVFDIEGMKTGIQEAQRYIKSLDKAFSAEVAGMDDWTKTATGMEKQLDKLGKQLVVQKQIVSKWEYELKKAQESGEASAAEIHRLTDNMNKAKVSVGRTEKSIRKYNEALRDLRMAEADKSVEAFSKAMDKANQKTQVMHIANVKAGRSWSVMGQVVANLATKALPALATAIINVAKASIKSSSEFEDAFVGVKKTVESTEGGFELLEGRLKGLEQQIPATASQLSRIAEVGGQLGISADDLAEFTKVMTMLGDATDLTAEDAGTLIAQFGEISGLQATEYENFASSLVALGNSYATTESKILDMATALASTLTITGASEQEILGFSAVMSSLGIEAQAGGTAVSRLFQNFQIATQTGKNLDKLAKTMGKTGDELKDSFGKDSVGTVTEFLETLKKIQDGGGSVISVLDELGIHESRMIDTIQRLTLGADRLPEAIGKSTDAWKDNVALTKEAEKRYDTYSSKVKILQNSFEETKRILGDLLTPARKAVFEDVTEILNSMNELLDPALKIAKAYEDVGTAFENLGKITSNTELTPDLKPRLATNDLAALVEGYDTFIEKREEQNKKINALQTDIDFARTGIDNAKATLADPSVSQFSIAATQASEIIAHHTKVIEEDKAEQDNWKKSLAETDTEISNLVRGLAEITGGSDAYLSVLRQMSPELAKAVESELKLIDAEKAKQKAIDASAMDEYLRTQTATALAQDKIAEATKKTDGTLLAQKKAVHGLIIQENKQLRTIEEGSEAYIIQKKVIEALYAEEKRLGGEWQTELDKRTQEAQAKAQKLEEDANAVSLKSYTSYMTTYEKAEAKYSQIVAEKARLEKLRGKASSEAKNQEIEDAYRIVTAEEERLRVSRETARQNLETYQSQAELYSDSANYINLDVEQLEDMQTVLKQILEDAKEGEIDIDSEALDKIEEQLGRINTAIGETTKGWADKFKDFMDDIGESDPVAGFLKDIDKVLDEFAPVLDPLKNELRNIWELAQPDFAGQQKVLDKELKLIKDNAKKKQKVNDDTENEAKNALEKRLESGQITQLEYYKQLEKAESAAAENRKQIEAEQEAEEKRVAQEKDALARRQFESQKANAIAQVWINAGVATLQAFAHNWIVGLAAGAFLSTTAGIQTALINKQQYVPAFEKGGMVPKGQLFLAGENGREVMTEYKGRTMVMPIEKHTEWIDALADRLVVRINGNSGNSTTDSHDKSYNITQQIYARPQSKREIYLQTHKAIRRG